MSLTGNPDLQTAHGLRSLVPDGSDCARPSIYREVVTGGIIAQTEAVMANIMAVLELADCGLEHVVQVGVWLDDPRDFTSFNSVFAKYFSAHPPARATVQSALMVDAKVEMDLVAYKPVKESHQANAKVIDIISHMCALEGTFPKPEQLVADFVLTNLEEISFLSQHEIAEAHADGYMRRMPSSTLTAGDVLVAISASGQPAELLDSVAIAKQYGAATISLTKTGSDLA